jgi:integrase
MARLPREYRLETRDARGKLKARGEPYWRAIVAGTFIGYRKGKRASAWVARQRSTAGGYAEQRIGTPDDHATADGAVVLSYAQAVKLATTMQLEDRQPLPRHYADGLTLNDVFDQYLQDRQVTPGGRFGRVMPTSTADVSRGTWNLRVREGIGAKMVTALDAKALRKWHAALITQPPTCRGKKLDYDPTDPEQLRSRRNTANRVLTLVKASLSWARRNELLADNMPDWWRNVQPFNLGDDAEPRMMETGEITRLLNAAPKDLRDLLSGALMTGARYGELCGLLVRDYDPDTSTVRIVQTKTYKTLRQPLTPEGVALFDRLTAGRESIERLFTRADGRGWGKSDATKPMAAAVEAAKLADVTFKTTRATYGKLLLVATRDIEMVARALGHSDSRITRKHYARYIPSELASAVAMLPALGFNQDSRVSRIGKKRRAKG